MNMRKILFITLLLFASISAFGQMVSSSSLVVTKTKKQLPEVKPGYEQSIDVAYSYFFNDEMGIDLNYIGGWRFNRMFYAGLGTGLYFDVLDYGGVRPNNRNYMYYKLDLQTVNVPLYAHGKVYFTQKRYMPFIGLSIGGTFSSPKDGRASYGYTIPYSNGNYEWKENNFPFSYGTCRFLLNPIVGVDYRINADMDLYLSLGYRGMTQPKVTNLTQYSISIGQTFVGAIDLHIGFTF